LISNKTRVLFGEAILEHLGHYESQSIHIYRMGSQLKNADSFPFTNTVNSNNNNYTEVSHAGRQDENAFTYKIEDCN